MYIFVFNLPFSSGKVHLLPKEIAVSEYTTDTNCKCFFLAVKHAQIIVVDVKEKLYILKS